LSGVIVAMRRFYSRKELDASFSEIKVQKKSPAPQRRKGARLIY